MEKSLQSVPEAPPKAALAPPGVFSRGCAGSGPCSAKTAEPIRRRYLQRHPPSDSIDEPVSPAPHPGPAESLRTREILQALPPWLPHWAAAKPTFMMRKTFTENNRHLAETQTRIARLGRCILWGPAQPGTARRSLALP